MAFNYEKYLRLETLPHIWCPGCGHGIILKSLLRAIDKLGWEKNDVVVVSGIGCASRLPAYVDFNTLHTTHGRALPFATGIKMVKPHLKVIVVSGDGDTLAIGGNHFLHACRRNIDMTLVVFNNSTYGMTGGQRSPTTPQGGKTTTTPYGNPHSMFDVVGLAQAAGATYVARSTAYHVVHMERMIRGGLQHKGFSVIEVLEDCPTAYGRRNNFRSPVAMLEHWRDTAVTLEKSKGLPPEELAGKVLIGKFHEVDAPDFADEYARIARSMGGAKG
jgi:2-oxoglutarate ferredoxin oxidoreductase subunit beta